MNKKILIVIFTLTMNTVNSDALPVFDGVSVGVQVRNMTEQLIRNYRQLQQLAQQVKQYDNQYGEISNILKEMESLEFIETGYGYMPKDWGETVKVLQGISKTSINKSITSQIQKLLNRVENLNIKDELTKVKLNSENKKAVKEYQLYLMQIKAAQNRIKNTKQLTEILKTAKTQKAREAINTQVGIENIRSSSEIANILAIQYAKQQQKELDKLKNEQEYQEILDEFVNSILKP